MVLLFCLFSMLLCPAQDFVELILASVVPTQGREIVCEVLVGSLDFRVYIDQLEVTVAGLTPNPGRSAFHVNHCWRFVKREARCFASGTLAG